jgi:hypothetical protein
VAGTSNVFEFGFLNGDAGEIRTPDQLVRSQLLYPTELQRHKNKTQIVPEFSSSIDENISPNGSTNLAGS